MKKTLLLLASAIILFACEKEKAKPTPGNTSTPATSSSTSQRSEDGILYLDANGVEIDENAINLNDDNLIILAEIENTDEARVFNTEASARAFLDGMANQTIANNIKIGFDYVNACRGFEETTAAQAYFDQTGELPQQYIDLVSAYEADHDFPAGKSTGIGSLYDACTTTGSYIWLTRHPVLGLYGWANRISSFNFICTYVAFHTKNFYRGSSIWIAPWNASSAWTHSFCSKYTNWNNSSKAVQWF